MRVCVPPFNIRRIQRHLSSHIAMCVRARDSFPLPLQPNGMKREISQKRASLTDGSTNGALSLNRPFHLLDIILILFKR